MNFLIDLDKNILIMEYFDIEEKIYFLYKSRKTVLEMLTDRGYKNPEKEHLEFNQFCKKYDPKNEMIEKDIKDRMTMIFEKNNEKIKIYWYPEPKLGAEFRNIIQELKKENIKNAVIVTELSVTHHAKQTLKGLKYEGIFIDVFFLKDIQTNISKNRLVPKHIICSKEEKIKIMKTYKVNRNQLPYIKSFDPMVKYLGAKKGNLIKIIRDSEVLKGEKVITYRIVI